MTSRFALLRDGSPEWADCERALTAAGLRLPLPHRAGWSTARRGVTSRCIALRSPDGCWAAAIGLQVAASRALPGFRVLRVERFGEGVPPALWPDAVRHWPR